MLRYLRLYAYCLRFSFSKAMEFRVDFYFRIAMDFIYYATNIAFYRVIYQHTSLLGGWTESEMMVFVGAYLVVDALNMTFFANNLWWLPHHINKGDLDYYLTRPVSSMFLLSLREFAANSALNLVMALGVLLWALSGLEAWPSGGHVVLFGVLIVNGAFLYYLTHMTALIPVFWMHSARGLGNVFFFLTRFMERPDRIFTGWVRVLLTTAMPFGLMASFPAQVVLDGPVLGPLGQIALVTLLFFCFVTWFWRRGLRAYSSASS